MILRPIQQSDYQALVKIAVESGHGFTSLPVNEEMLRQRISRSEDSFNAQVNKPGDQGYLFVMEDTETGQVVGTTGIEAAVGLDNAFYHYHLGKVVHSSRELGIHNTVETLALCNDYTGASEICTLFLRESHRKDGNGRFLSRCRFLFIAEFPHLFDQRLVAEMRGYSDKDGISPFWEGLGKHFFSIDFTTADKTSSVDKAFIAELMPKYPIYLPMLPDAARAVIGRVHENTAPALKMLQAEGFNFNGMVDIFDGGPAVEAFIHSIRTVREGINRHVMIRKKPLVTDVPAEQQVMISNRSFRDFRVTTIPAECIGLDTVSIPADVAEALEVESGDLVRLAPLKDTGRR